MKWATCAAIFVAQLFFTPAHAQAGAGLVTRFSGQAQIVNVNRTPLKVSPFMKINAGDRVEMQAGSSLKLVYFANGREEAWKDNATFEVGAEASHAIQGAPEVTSLPASAPRGRELARTQSFDTITRIGSVRMRYLPREGAQFETVAAAKRSYDAWRATAANDDLLPDVYYFSVLDEFNLRDEMQYLAAEAVKRNPGSEVAKAMQVRAHADRTGR